ncbi:MAG: ABC transporter ATP-binding protein, partial [Helicobacter sp.]|nr:ABC transporter ATP-binding protein [Helicobacter sp.]
MSLFRVENGAFYRNKKIIFEKMNFEVNGGEVLAILGCNGVGKTTLIQCCMGFLKWQKGKSYLQNKVIESIDSKELFSKIGFIPQAKNFNIGLSVFDMVLLGCNAKIDFNPKKEHLLKVEKILQEVGIMYLKDKTCDALSGGELQMVIFARALVNDPLMVILDEPES